MRLIVFMVMSLLILFISSCASVGQQIDVEQVKQSIIIDKSTKDDVLRICGEPTSTEFGYKSGSEVIHYEYIKKNVSAGSVIGKSLLGLITLPVGGVGALAVGTQWQAEKTCVDVYLDNNIVKDVKVQTGANTTTSYGR